MKTTIPLHIDTADLARLRDQLPDLSKLDLSKMELPKMELPKLEGVGKTADETIDRLLGRSRMRVWPWVATGIGLVALMSAAAAAFMWFRRPPMDTSTSLPAAGTPAVSSFTDGPLTNDTATLDDLDSVRVTSPAETERIFRGDEVV